MRTEILAQQPQEPIVSGESLGSVGLHLASYMLTRVDCINFLRRSISSFPFPPAAPFSRIANLSSISQP
jgi:hypothetical protein